MVKAMDLQLSGCGFDSRHYTGKVVHAHVPLSLSSINWYWSKGSIAVWL